MSEVQSNCRWLHPPYGQERLAIVHYKTCKDKDPTNTSAIIVVPTKGIGHSTPWTPLLQGMVLLKQYTKEDMIYTSGTRRFGKTRMVEIWWDPPLPPPPKLPHGYTIGNQTNFMYAVHSGAHHDMVFACTINDKPALALIDSGASASFVVTTVVDPKQIEPLPHPLSVLCAGNNQLQINGTARLSVRVGSYRDMIPTNVVSTLIEGIDLILGRDWLMANKVVINY